MKAIVGCEFSGVVRRALRQQGIDAWSCDLLPSEDDSQYHIQGDILEHLNDGWDLGIFHPPCTDLAVSGARHFAAKVADGRQQRSLEFVKKLLDAPIPAIALENPVSIISSRIRKPDQIIQPWQFGHGETKATCLWLKGLPKLSPTNIVEGREPRVHRMSPGPNRWKERSRTFEGIAAAMADQWGNFIMCSSSKYSYMSDEEFVRFADGMVGWDLYKEALARLDRRLQDEVEIKELEEMHQREVDDLNAEIGILETRIEELESELEHA